MNYEMKSKLAGGGPASTNMDSTSLFRGTSCVGEPQESAFRSLQGRDLRQFTDVVNNPDEEGRHTFPLPAQHWINQELEGRHGQTLLLEAVTHHLHQYTEVLLKAGARADLYSQELGAAPLHLAVQSGDLSAVKLLLDEHKVRPSNKADVNQLNKAGRSGLHLAVEQKDVDIIDFLLSQKDVNVDVKDKKGNQTPLYLAVKNKSPQLVEMLVENGASIENVCFGKTIHQHILEKLPGFDISGIKRKSAPLARQGSTSVLSRLVDILDEAALTKMKHQTVEAGLLTELKSLCLECDSKSLNTFRSSGFTLLQRAATGNLDEFADVLLSEGVDPNYCPEESSAHPVHLAASRGHAEVLTVLKKHKADFTSVKKSTEETVLHRVLVRDDEYPIENLQNALNVILSEDDETFKSQIDQIINKRDLLGNTPLHYGTQKWPQSVVRRLLERGANIGIKNKWSEIPINKIDPATMESFLDEFCLQSQNDVNQEDFEVTFRYQFLAPPVEVLPAEVQGPYADDYNETQKLSDKYGAKKFALPETESLWYMGQSREHRHLLKHPVITSFLWCKWTRIRRFVNRNMRFYMFFVMLLTWFIFENYGGESLKNPESKTISAFYGLFVVFSCTMLLLVIRDWITDVKDVMRQEQIMLDSGVEVTRSPGVSYLKLVLSNWVECLFLASLCLVLVLGVPVLSTALTVLLVLLAGRELFQMSVSLRRYVFTLENWVEILMVAFVSVLLFTPDQGRSELKRHLAGLSLLLSWGELVTFVAKHPRLTRYNVYVTMFFNVLKTFSYFLLWYGCYIFAFSMGFYIILQKDSKVTNTTASAQTNEDDDGLQPFFDSPFLTFVKSFTMFVGELEFSDIPIDRSSILMPLSYLYFLSFVLLIVVVLMNLLNGLAVSDIREIQEKATTVAYLSIVDTISYAESLLLGDPFDFLSNVPALNWMMKIPSLSCCRQIYRNKLARRIMQKMTGAQGILLFYNFLPDKKLRIKPNVNKDSCVKIEKLSPDIVEAAKKIVLQQQKDQIVPQEASEMRTSMLEQRMEEMSQENKLLLGKVDKLEQKIDELLLRI